MGMYVLFSVLIAASVGLGVIGLRQTLAGAGGRQRIEDLAAAVQKTGSQAGAGRRRRGVLDSANRALAERGLARNLATELARADLSLTVAEYLVMRTGFAIGGFLIGYMIHRNVVSGLLLGIVGAILPQFYLKMRQDRRLSKFNKQLPDVLERLVGSLRAGYGVTQGFEWLAREMADPAGSEFQRVMRETQLGLSLPQALENMVRRLDSSDLSLVVSAIQIQHEVGGSLADILETVAETIRERVRIQRDIRVLTAQQRFSAYVLIALPIGLALFLFVINPKYESQLFTPGPTLCIPIGTGLMMILGYLILQRIVKIEV